jgi:hypothetical protein
MQKATNSTALLCQACGTGGGPCILRSGAEELRGEPPQRLPPDSRVTAPRLARPAAQPSLCGFGCETGNIGGAQRSIASLAGLSANATGTGPAAVTRSLPPLWSQRPLGRSHGLERLVMKAGSAVTAHARQRRRKPPLPPCPPQPP